MKILFKKIANAKIFIDPFFLVFIITYSLVNRSFMLVIYLITLLFHEFAHFAVSKHFGYHLSKIKIMPYGASLSIDNNIYCAKEEILIALAGPLLNLIICIILISLWWIFPATYDYTSLLFLSNLSIFLINLLPIFPLDGGRILKALLANLSNKKKKTILYLTTTVLLLLFFTYFIYTLFNQANFYVLFFIIFISMSYFDVVKSQYNVSSFFYNEKKYNSYLKTKIYSVNSSKMIYQLSKFYSPDYYIFFNIIFPNNKTILLSEHRFIQISTKYPPFVKLEQIFLVK